MASTNTIKIETPMEIRTPFPFRVKDHGLTLVHSLAGNEVTARREVRTVAVQLESRSVLARREERVLVPAAEDWAIEVSNETRSIDA
jgi:hypothetical protein